ncbi:MAG: outer membrane protein OmpA family [Bacteroidetes bacterium]|jgi:outer membrane protein OmpA-like peptidoglycan-associated protein|nr:outer membrane protein OmpA family [Bacteroidota bacterium]
MKIKSFIVALAVAANLNAQTGYEVINLGTNVNTNLEELAPYITPDGKKIFFVRQNDPGNTQSPKYPNQDIWYCKSMGDGKWDKAQHLGFPFNTSTYNSIIGQSSDGNTRYIKGHFSKGEWQKMGFSKSILKEDGWTDPKGFDVPKYAKMVKSKTISNSLSASNNILLMSFGEDEGKDEHSIYVSFLKDDDWTKPMKLPAPINTGNGEGTPFLASDNVTLYFNSYRPGGYGSADIWMSKRLDDTWQKWSEPVNLGNQINSSAWDAYFTIPASGDYFYMVKNGDVCKIKAKEEQKPNPVVLITGKVLNSKTNAPIGTKINYIDLATGTELGIANSNPKTGEYTIILPYGKNYSFKANEKGFYSVTENLDCSNIKSYQEITKNLYLSPIETGQVIRINNIFFETAKSVLKAESFFELDNLVKLLTENSSMEIAIAGHTDNVGKDDYNMNLSKERAAAVVTYLTGKGIAAARLTSDGFGKTKPVADNTTDEGKSLNRRVEFTIMKK